MPRPEKSFRIFDSHTHAFPEKVAARAMAVTSGKAGIPYYHDGSFEGLLGFEACGGADGFLLLPIATNPAMTRSVNDWAAAREGGGVQAFGSVHPEYDDFENELERIASLGLKGIKLHPEYQEFYADEPRLFPLYRAAFDLGLIVYFHAGVDLGYPPPIRGEAPRIARVCDAFPDGRIVAAHMGGLWQSDVVTRFLAGRENLWLDTSFAAGRTPSGDFVKLARRHGTRRILFGTDAPWTEFHFSRDAVLHSGLDDAELADIFYDNAARLLNLE